MPRPSWEPRACRLDPDRPQPQLLEELTAAASCVPSALPKPCQTVPTPRHMGSTLLPPGKLRFLLRRAIIALADTDAARDQ